MKKLLVATTSAVAMLATLAVVFVERVDGGVIVTYGQHVADPIGEVRLAFTRHTRDCASVVRYPTGSAKLELFKRFVSRDEEDGKATPRLAMTSGSWALVETDFSNAEPGIALLRGTGAEAFTVVSWYGGTAAPFNDVQAIHDYFRREAPLAQKELIDCFEPVGAPFDRASQ